MAGKNYHIMKIVGFIAVVLLLEDIVVPGSINDPRSFILFYSHQGFGPILR